MPLRLAPNCAWTHGHIPMMPTEWSSPVGNTWKVKAVRKALGKMKCLHLDLFLFIVIAFSEACFENVDTPLWRNTDLLMLMLNMFQHQCQIKLAAAPIWELTSTTSGRCDWDAR